MPATIVITGASSGIGRALALQYARDKALIALLGRDQTRLDAVAADCRARGAETITAAFDVRDRVGLWRWLNDFDSVHPVDLVIANAGMLVRMAARPTS